MKLVDLRLHHFRADLSSFLSDKQHKYRSAGLKRFCQLHFDVLGCTDFNSLTEQKEQQSSEGRLVLQIHNHIFRHTLDPKLHIMSHLKC